MCSANMLRLVLRKGKGHSAVASPTGGAVGQYFGRDQTQESRLKINPANHHVDGSICSQRLGRFTVRVGMYEETRVFLSMIQKSPSFPKNLLYSTGVLLS